MERALMSCVLLSWLTALEAFLVLVLRWWECSLLHHHHWLCARVAGSQNFFSLLDQSWWHHHHPHPMRHLFHYWTLGSSRALVWPFPEHWKIDKIMFIKIAISLIITNIIIIFFIDWMHKWRPKMYSFVYVLIRLSSNISFVFCPCKWG